MHSRCWTNCISILTLQPGTSNACSRTRGAASRTSGSYRNQLSSALDVARARG